MRTSALTNRFRTDVLCLLAFGFLVTTCEEINAKAMPYALKLPKNIGVWTRPDSPRTINASNIFDYMDGAGELYLAYRFNKLGVYKYKAGGREYIEAEIYFMETSDDAFGLLSHDWDGNPVDMKSSLLKDAKASRSPFSRALYSGGLLRIWSGSLYARIMASRETPESKKAVLSLGRVIAEHDTLPDEPRLLHVLSDEIPDGWKLQRNQLRYFRTHQVLNTFYYLSLENILDLDLSAEAVTATYEKRGDDKSKQAARLIFVKYSTPEKASRGLDLFRKSYMPDKDSMAAKTVTNEEPVLFQKDGSWVGYRIKRECLALVLKCPDEKSARALIDGIRFDSLK